MILDFLKTPPSLNLLPQEPVELERRSEGKLQFHFGEVAPLVRKRTLTVKVSPPPSPDLQVGEEVRLTVVRGHEIRTWKSAVRQLEQEAEADQDMHAFSPPDEIELIEVPRDYAGVRIPLTVPAVALSAGYRAMQSAYLQTSAVQEIWKDGLSMLTNVPIPDGTLLAITLEFPFRRSSSLKGRVVKSQRFQETKKHLAEVEFEEARPVEIHQLMQYGLFCFRRMDTHAGEWEKGEA